MKQRRSSPAWYAEEDVRDSIRAARDAEIDWDSIVSTLANHELEGVPERRIEAIVDATPVSTSPDAGLPLSQLPSTDATPRSSNARVFSLEDAEYLSRREFARIVGLTLELFEGNTVRPAANQDVAVDIYWHRQQVTVGLRTVPTNGRVGTEHIAAIEDGTVRVEGTRSPSELAVATNGFFTDNAVDLAAQSDVRLFDGEYVQSWLDRAALSPGVVGTVLEDGEDHDGPLTDLVDVSPIPEPLLQDDPFDVGQVFDRSALKRSVDDCGRDDTDANSTEPAQSSPVENPLTGERPPTGEIGTLYADPAEDGDYEAFDGYLEKL